MSVELSPEHDLILTVLDTPTAKKHQVCRRGDEDAVRGKALTPTRRKRHLKAGETVKPKKAAQLTPTAKSAKSVDEEGDKDEMEEEEHQAKHTDEGGKGHTSPVKRSNQTKAASSPCKTTKRSTMAATQPKKGRGRAPR
jgi:hypothetical protein